MKHLVKATFSLYRLEKPTLSACIPLNLDTNLHKNDYYFKNILSYMFKDRLVSVTVRNVFGCK